MRKLLVLALAALAVTAFAPSARAENDCCFDRALPPVDGSFVCVEAADVNACFARAGRQIFVPDFDCVANGDNSCLEKIGSQPCELSTTGGISGSCSYTDLQLETVLPGMSTWTLGVLMALLATASIWMLARRRTDGTLA